MTRHSALNASLEAAFAHAQVAARPGLQCESDIVSWYGPVAGYATHLRRLDARGIARGRRGATSSGTAASCQRSRPSV